MDFCYCSFENHHSIIDPFFLLKKDHSIAILLLFVLKNPSIIYSVRVVFKK
jgi:hypothetical protein